MRFFDFLESYIKMCELLLYSFESCTINNGNLSKFFEVSRSCHQGCPLSPYLYLVCGQVLSQLIKDHSGIHGIRWESLEYLIAQFADDTQLFLDSKKSLEQVIRALNTIETNIGLRVNYDKTNVVRLGDASKCIENKPLIWDPGGMMVLGIDVLNDANVQYKKIISKAKQVLEPWRKRKLSIMGRVLIVNTLVISLFIYALQVLDGPNPTIVKEFNQLIESFLWKGKKAKISREVLEAKKSEGGLALVNFELKNQSLKASWIVREDDMTQQKLWTSAFEQLGTTIWDCAVEPSDFVLLIENSDTEAFWKECMFPLVRLHMEHSA